MMKTHEIKGNEYIHIYGRTDGSAQGVPLFWSSAGMECRIKGSRADVRIECRYTTMKPYLSIEVDGLRAQTFSPLPGTHWYNAFLGLDGQKTHTLRLIRETQPFGGDPEALMTLLQLKTDGTLEKLPPKKRRIEFIGDSVTSVEGGRGPIEFMEWVPMVFSAADGYPRLAAEKLRADYHVISQSGWGVLAGWNNDPHSILPAIYDDVCQLTEAGRKPWDFSFDPDTVVIALGANDRGAMMSPPFTDTDGKTYKLTDSPEDRQRFEKAAVGFLRHLHEKNPNARLLWLSIVPGTPVEDALHSAVEGAAADGIPVELFTPYDLFRPFRGAMGSRSHPGVRAHERMAEALVKKLK